LVPNSTITTSGLAARTSSTAKKRGSRGSSASPVCCPDLGALENGGGEAPGVERRLERRRELLIGRREAVVIHQAVAERRDRQRAAQGLDEDLAIGPVEARRAVADAASLAEGEAALVLPVEIAGAIDRVRARSLVQAQVHQRREVLDGGAVGTKGCHGLKLSKKTWLAALVERRRRGRLSSSLFHPQRSGFGTGLLARA
jgi:hypothetical protein